MAADAAFNPVHDRIGRDVDARGRLAEPWRADTGPPSMR